MLQKIFFQSHNPERGIVDMFLSQDKSRKNAENNTKISIWPSLTIPRHLIPLTGNPNKAKFVYMVHFLHDEMTSVVIESQIFESFKVQTGVKQDCIIVPTLFSRYLFAVLYLVKHELPSGI